MASSAASLFNTDRIDHLYQDPHVDNRNFVLHYGDLTDSTSLVRIVQKVQPDEIYNLAAQSHVAVSLKSLNTPPTPTVLVPCACSKPSEFWVWRKDQVHQASTSELYGLVQEFPRRKPPPSTPQPLRCSKMYALLDHGEHRRAYGIYACNGVLFNHESPVRGETFVTRKITRAISRIALGLQDCLYLGNMSALRDWGHAKTTSKCNG